MKLYVQYLQKGLENHLRFISDSGFCFSELDTLYIGGGTPSLLDVDSINYLLQYLNKLGAKISKKTEFSIEINPKTVNSMALDSWRQVGVNRFSIGIQSLNEKCLKFLERPYSLKDCFDALNLFENLKLNYSVDFMLGLPFQNKTKRNIINEFEQLEKFSPKHISVYVLTPPNKYKYLNDLPDEDWIRAEYFEVCEYLKNKGFVHYEVSNWAKFGSECLHNMVYWKGNSWASVGPSAVGTIYNDNVGLRYCWDKYLPKFIIEKLNKKDIRLEKLYLGLRTKEGIIIDEFFSFKEILIIQKLFDRWIEDGLGNCAEGRFILNSKGFFILDGLIEQIFFHIRSL